MSSAERDCGEAGVAEALDHVATGVAIFCPSGDLVHANASLRRFLAGRDPEVAALPDAAGRLVLPDGRDVAVQRIPLEGGAWAVLIPAPAEDADFLRHVLDCLDTCVVAYGEDDRYLFGNVAYHARYPHLPAESELIGVSFGDMLRRTIAAGAFADLQAETDPEGFVARRVAEFRAGQPEVTERMTASGNWELVRTATTPSGMHLSLRTRITEVRRVQEELRRTKERLENEAAVRASFIARLSHDFRTPLTAVLGYAEMIEQEVQGPLATPKYREYAALIQYSGQHLLDLVADLVKSEPEESGSTIRETVIDIPALLRREVMVIAPLAQANGSQLVMHLAGAVRLHGDSRLVRQMVLNLLSNAVRFCDRGMVSVSVEIRDDRGLDIVVTDTGVGMSAEVVARLGEPFYRGEEGAEPRPPGTGLGLGVVKELMARHQGHLRITSTPGQGTRAVLEFPPERTA